MLAENVFYINTKFLFSPSLLLLFKFNGIITSSWSYLSYFSLQISFGFSLNFGVSRIFSSTFISFLSRYSAVLETLPELTFAICLWETALLLSLLKKSFGNFLFVPDDYTLLILTFSFLWSRVLNLFFFSLKSCKHRVSWKLFPRNG